MLFYYAYIIYLISMFLTYTMFDYIPTFTIINNGIRYTVVPALLVASLAQNKIQANNTLIILSGIILFLLFNFVFSFDKSTLLVVFIIFIAKDVNYESIITVSLWVTIGMLLFIFGSCTLGLIENRIYVQEFGTRVRYSWGFSYANMPSKFFLSITMMVIYLRKSKITFKEIILLLLLNSVFYLGTTTRMPLIIAISIILGAIIIKYSKDNGVIKNFLLRYGVCCVPISAFISIAGTYLYPKYKFLHFINQLINNRFYYGYKALSDYGVTILGRKLPPFVGPMEIRDNPQLTYNYVDSAYLQLLLTEGLIFVLILCVLFVLLGKKILKNKDFYTAFILIVIATCSIIEPGLLKLSYYPFLFYFGIFFKQWYRVNKYLTSTRRPYSRTVKGAIPVIQKNIGGTNDKLY